MLYPVFDFCGTLIKGNTTLAFLRHLALRHKFRVGLPYLYWTIVAKARKVSGGEYMKIRLRCLRGIPLTLLHQSAISLAHDWIGSKELPLAKGDFRAACVGGAKPAIVSATLDFIAFGYLKATKQLDLSGPILASTLEIKNGKSTGFYADFLPDRGKWLAFSPILSDLGHQGFHYFTDDAVADADMCAWASQITLVEP